MLRIRLRRVGKKGNPSYRIVVAEANAPRDGAYLDWIGNYDPMVDPPAISLKQDRAVHWLGQGAQPSDAVKRILGRAGVVEWAPANRPGVPASVAETAEEAAVGESTEEAAVGESTGEAAVGESTGEAAGDEAADEPPAGGAPADETTDEAPKE